MRQSHEGIRNVNIRQRLRISSSKSDMPTAFMSLSFPKWVPSRTRYWLSKVTTLRAAGFADGQPFEWVEVAVVVVTTLHAADFAASQQWIASEHGQVVACLWLILLPLSFLQVSVILVLLHADAPTFAVDPRASGSHVFASLSLTTRELHNPPKHGTIHTCGCKDLEFWLEYSRIFRRLFALFAMRRIDRLALHVCPVVTDEATLCAHAGRMAERKARIPHSGNADARASPDKTKRGGSW